MSGVVDSLRQVQTDLGLRVYQVRLIWTRWLGGSRGRGEEYVWHEELLTPTPKVADLSALSRRAAQPGGVEEGGLMISEISPRYSEATLLGTFADVVPGPDTNFFWEVQSPARDGSPTVARRFFPSGPPAFVPERFMWTIKLSRAQGDRAPAPLKRA
jgi:hypothetical protein